MRGRLTADGPGMLLLQGGQGGVVGLLHLLQSRLMALTHLLNLADRETRSASEHQLPRDSFRTTLPMIHMTVLKQMMTVF